MNAELFNQILSKHKRVAIVGGPKVGKTTLSRLATDRVIHHNDDAKHLNWEDHPAYWINKAVEPSFVIEGVHVARALRKGLKVDAIVHLDQPHTELNKGQASMTKGHQKILNEALAMNPDIPVYK